MDVKLLHLKKTFVLMSLTCVSTLTCISTLSLARPKEASPFSTKIDLSDSDVLDEAGCYRTKTYYPPFLVSDVYRQRDSEHFEKPNGKVVKVSIDSDHLIAQYVNTKTKKHVRLPRGSLVAVSFSKDTLIDEKTPTGSSAIIDSHLSTLLERAVQSQGVPLTHQSYEGSNRKSEYLDIQVLTSNDIYSRMQDSNIAESSIENGDIAYHVPSSSLIALTGESRLVVKENFLFALPKLPSLNQAAETIIVEKDSYFQIPTNDSKEYDAYTCYEQKNGTLNIKMYYSIEFFDSSFFFKPTQYFINPFESNFAGKVLPLLDTQVKPLIEVQEKLKRIFKSEPLLDTMLNSFNEINYQGYLRLPTIENEEGLEESLDYIKSYIHYGSEVDPLDSDDWGQSSTICGIMELTHLWKQFCDRKYSGTGCSLQIGDIAFPVEGVVASKSRGSKWKKTKKGKRKQKYTKRPTHIENMPTIGKDLLGHASHHKGTCVDIRPLRDDNKYQATNLRTPAYSYQKTSAFVKIAQAYGATKLYFNDRRLIRAGLTKRQQGHDDHIHLCFEEKNFCEASSDINVTQSLFSSKQK